MAGVEQGYWATSSSGRDPVPHRGGEEFFLFGSACAEVMTNAELMSRFVKLGLVLYLSEFVLGVDLADHFPSFRRHFGRVEVLNRTA